MFKYGADKPDSKIGGIMVGIPNNIVMLCVLFSFGYCIRMDEGLS